jgi:hypothetical protein
MALPESAGRGRLRPALRLVETKSLSREDWTGGFGNGAFEDGIEDVAAVADEFYPAQSGNDHSHGDGNAHADAGGTPATASLKDRLEQRASLLGGKTA